MTDRRKRAAAFWCERLEDADARTRRRFEDWRSDPSNDDAWAAVNSARELGVTLADHPMLQDLRTATKARVTPGQAPRTAPWKWAAAACAILAVSGVGGQMLIQDLAKRGMAPAPAALVGRVYRTQVGQTLPVALPDGSRMTLDTASTVRVAYSGTERRLILERGRALFAVARHRTRPFVVAAGGQEVTAHGTKFDVRLEPALVRVALVEGTVSVAASGASAAAVAMVPDDVLIASARGISVRHDPGSAAMLTSWSEGQLIFENETVGRAVAEMRRYGGPPVTFADPEAAALRVSGSFRTGDMGPFLEALQLGLPVRVTHDADGRVHIASRK